MRDRTLKAKYMAENPKFTMVTTVKATALRVTGDVSRRFAQSANEVKAKNSDLPKVARLLLLNIVLAFALAVCVLAVVLTKATSQLMVSFAITLVTAVIAIVTSCFLSIGKKLILKSHIFNKYLFPRFFYSAIRIGASLDPYV